jgi:hypothetical protein
MHQNIEIIKHGNQAEEDAKNSWKTKTSRGVLRHGAATLPGEEYSPILTDHSFATAAGMQRTVVDTA